MNSTLAGVIFIVSLALALALAYRPFGDYMYRVVSGTRQSRVERVFSQRVAAMSELDGPVYGVCICVSTLGPVRECP